MIANYDVKDRQMWLLCSLNGLLPWSCLPQYEVLAGQGAYVPARVWMISKLQMHSFRNSLVGLFFMVNGRERFPTWFSFDGALKAWLYSKKGYNKVGNETSNLHTFSFWGWYMLYLSLSYCAAVVLMFIFNLFTLTVRTLEQGKVFKLSFFYIEYITKLNHCSETCPVA